MVKQKQFIKVAILLFAFVFMSGLVLESLAQTSPVTLAPPDIIKTPDEYDFSQYGYVKVIVYRSEKLTIPLKDAGVFLMALNHYILDYKTTDPAGETGFLALAGTYIIRAHNGADYIEQEVTIPAGNAADPLYFLFSYNPTYPVGTSGSSSSASNESEPNCPGLLKVRVIEDLGSMVILVPDVEVTLTTDLGDMYRTGYTNMYGEASFVTETGLYLVSSKLNGTIQARWIFLPCNQTPETLSFYY